MKTVAVSPAVNQAIADLSAEVTTLLQRAHEGATDDLRAAAAAHLRRLREFVRCTGVDLNDVPAWNAHTANWRAIARLAGRSVETTQAG